MRKFLSLAFVAVGVTVTAGSADATPSCVLDGTWTAVHPVAQVVFTTKVVAATHAYTVDRTGGGLPDAHIVGSYTYDSASQRITVTNTSVSTQDLAFYACLNVPGTYTVNFPDCTHMTLGLVTDACAPRSQSSPHATFTKQ